MNDIYDNVLDALADEVVNELGVALLDEELVPYRTTAVLEREHVFIKGWPEYDANLRCLHFYFVMINETHGPIPLCTDVSWETPKKPPQANETPFRFCRNARSEIVFTMYAAGSAAIRNRYSYFSVVGQGRDRAREIREDMMRILSNSVLEVSYVVKPRRFGDLYLGGADASVDHSLLFDHALGVIQDYVRAALERVHLRAETDEEFDAVEQKITALRQSYIVLEAVPLQDGLSADRLQRFYTENMLFMPFARVARRGGRVADRTLMYRPFAWPPPTVPNLLREADELEVTSVPLSDDDDDDLYDVGLPRQQEEVDFHDVDNPHLSDDDSMDEQERRVRDDIMSRDD